VPIKLFSLFIEIFAKYGKVSIQDRAPYQDSYDYGRYQSHNSYDYEQVRAFIAPPHILQQHPLTIK
jgi:hypothetical protein